MKFADISRSRQSVLSMFDSLPCECTSAENVVILVLIDRVDEDVFEDEDTDSNCSNR